MVISHNPGSMFKNILSCCFRESVILINQHDKKDYFGNSQNF